MWIKTKHLYSNDYYELYNMETGFYIYMMHSEKYDAFLVSHAKTYTEDGKSYGNCIYIGTEAQCEKVIEKIAQKLGIHNEINPETHF